MNICRYIVQCIIFLNIISVSAENAVVLKNERLNNLEVSRNQGLATAFTGMVDGHVTVAGGANFPDIRVEEGGQKKTYCDIFTLTDNNWEKTGELPKPVAAGSSVPYKDGMICIGGNDGQNLLDNVWYISKSGVSELPSLPVALTEHSAAISGNTVYVVGGKTYDNSPVSPSHSSSVSSSVSSSASFSNVKFVENKYVYALDLKDGNEWKQLSAMPGRGRLQCVSTVQNGNTSPCLYVFGGYSIDKSPIEVQTSGLCLNLKTLEWNQTADMPINITGGTCSVIGYSHILLMGGFNKEIFESRVNDPNPSNDYFKHEPDWYKFNDKVLVYHTITNVFFELDKNSLLARCGAGLVSSGNDSWIYINGELKPGVRSMDVTKISVTREVSFGWLNWTVLVLYLLGMLLLGYYFMKRESGADDFFKGGGRIPWWAAGISIYATMLSALTYMSIPAKAYALNWTYYPILATIIFVSWVVVKYYLPYFRRLNITSAYEYLEIRFNLVTRILASSLFIIFMVARMALVLYLPSLALNAVTGINVELCIVLMGVVTIIYCTMGGVEAVVWGDVIQGIILVGGAIFAAVFLICNTEGGFDAFIQIGQDNDKFRMFEWSMDYRSVTFWVAIVGGLANNLISYTSDQTVIQRYLTTKDERSAAQSIWTNGLMCVFVSIVFYIIGTGLFTFFQTHPAELDVTMQKGDAIFPFFMMSQMPAGLAGLLIAAIFAATMSTISSNINSIATAYSVDFYKRFRKNVTDESMLRVARRTCLTSGVLGVAIALVMASWDILSLIDYFNTILGLLTGGLGGLFFIGVFMKNIKGPAALSGFVCGTAFVFWMTYCTDASLFLYGAAGMVVSVVVAWLVQCINNCKPGRR